MASDTGDHSPKVPGGRLKDQTQTCPSVHFLNRGLISRCHHARRPHGPHGPHTICRNSQPASAATGEHVCTWEDPKISQLQRLPEKSVCVHELHQSTSSHWQHAPGPKRVNFINLAHHLVKKPRRSQIYTYRATDSKPKRMGQEDRKSNHAAHAREQTPWRNRQGWRAASAAKSVRNVRSPQRSSRAKNQRYQDSLLVLIASQRIARETPPAGGIR